MPAACALRRSRSRGPAEVFAWPPAKAIAFVLWLLLYSAFAISRRRAMRQGSMMEAFNMFIQHKDGGLHAYRMDTDSAQGRCGADCAQPAKAGGLSGIHGIR